jgi:hypothetical protein
MDTVGSTTFLLKIPKTDNWIKCSERLPEESWITYELYFGNASKDCDWKRCFAVYVAGECWLEQTRSEERIPLDRPTHWRIPDEPPRE